MHSLAMNTVVATMLLAGCAVLQPVSHSVAKDVKPVEISGLALFDGYAADAATNISGVACIKNGNCLVVADEMVAIQGLIVTGQGASATFQSGRHYGTIFGDDVCKSVKKEKTCEEVDLEGVAVRGRTIFVTGSMGNKRSSGKRNRKSWFLARFDLADNGEPVDGSIKLQKKRKILKRLFSGIDELSGSINMPLQCGGLNVEGLAAIGDSLFFGLRAPANIEDGQAFIVQADMSVFDANKAREVTATGRHSLSFRDKDNKPLKNVGIRALETLGERLLIVTAESRVPAPKTFEQFKKLSPNLIERCSDNRADDENDNPLTFQDSGPMRPRIWIWDPKTGSNPVEIAHLRKKYRRQKLEGLAVLPGQSDGSPRIDLLLTFDDPDGVSALGILPKVRIPAAQ